jgi:hypothetical protein
VLEGSWNLRGNVLEKRSSEGDVEQLRTAADREQGTVVAPGGEHERNLRRVSREIARPAFLAPGLSIKRRLYIFAAGQEYAICAGDDSVDCIFVGERGYDDWYDPCYF